LQTRRAAIGMLAGVAALAGQVAPSQAGYGDAANVFGKITNKSGRSRQQQGIPGIIGNKWPS
jgi:hypothetical protein